MRTAGESGAMPWFRHAAEVIAALALGFFLAHCKPASNPGEVEAAYAAELLACIEKSDTRAQADECRKQVNLRYGLCNQQDWPKVTPDCP